MTQLMNFTPVIDEVVQDVGFMPALIFGIVFRYAQMEKGVCLASNATIADRANCSPKTVNRHLKTLVKEGYIIDKTPKRRHKPHEYTVTEKAGITVHLTGTDQPGGTESPTSKGETGRTESPTSEQVGRTESPTSEQVGGTESPTQVGQRVLPRWDNLSVKETLLRDSPKKQEDSSLPAGANAPPTAPQASKPKSSAQTSGQDALSVEEQASPPPGSAPPPSPSSMTVADAWEWAQAYRDDRAVLEHMLAQERAGKDRVTLTGSLEKLLEAAPGEEVTLRSPAQREQDAMIEALAALVYGVTEPEQFEALSVDAQANLRRYAHEFRAQDRTPEQVEQFGAWWVERWDWKRQRGEMIDPPSLRQIKNQWFGAMKWAKGQKAQSDGSARMPGDDPAQYRTNGSTRRRVLMPGDA